MSSNIFLPINKAGYRPVEDSSDCEMELGHRFSAFHYETVSGSAGTCIMVITPNTIKICDAWFSIEVDKAGLYELYEDVICSGGSAISSINNNRRSTIISNAIVVANPSIATVGTFIGAHIIGSTTGGASKSGGSSTTNKYRLKENTSYMLRFTTDLSSTRVTQGIYWRESDA